jgi:hypothetical protein
MFTDKIDVKDFDKMDPEYKDLLGRVLTIQADCEIGGPHLYVEKMLPAAPTKLDQLMSHVPPPKRSITSARSRASRAIWESMFLLC